MPEEFLQYISAQRRYSPRTCAVYREALEAFYRYAYPLDNAPEAGALPVPLSPRSSLRWIGFSREGLVATCDSHQHLRVLSGLAAQRSGLEYSQMEWVLLMSLRRAMKEKQSMVDARIPSNSIAF